jgi:hypothetical protein
MVPAVVSTAHQHGRIDPKERNMNKVKVLGASLAMALLVASPAAADTVEISGFGAESQFLFF